MSESILEVPHVATYLSPAEALSWDISTGDSAGVDRQKVYDALLKIWREIFGKDDIGASDDFFLLGGHSLKALQLQALVRTALAYEMDLRSLFDVPVLAELADYVAAEMARKTPTEPAAAPDEVAGNAGYHIRLEGIEASGWERCANQVVAQHETLRASLSLADGSPRLRILPYQPFALPVTDLTALDDIAREAEAERLLALDRSTPFDQAGARYRFAYYTMGSRRALVSLTIDPGIADPALARTLVREMLSAYAATVAAPQAEAPRQELPSARPAANPPSPTALQIEAGEECLVPLRREGSRPPLFLVHGGGGGTMNLLQFTRALNPDQPVYGIQAKGYSRKTTPLNRVEAMASYYIEAIRSVQPVGPYQIGGYSLGGVIAYEMARQLGEQGESVALVAILDTWMLDFSQNKVMVTPYASGARGLAGRAAFRIVEFLTTPMSAKRAYVAKRWKRFRFRIEMNRQVRNYQAMQVKGKDLPPALVNIQAISELAVRHYRPLQYSGKIVLFQAQEGTDTQKAAQLAAWERLAASVEVVPIPGAHATIVVGENNEVLARAMERFLIS